MWSTYSAQRIQVKKYRPVARIGRAPDSKSEGWGFESLLACQKVMNNKKKANTKQAPEKSAIATKLSEFKNFLEESRYEMKKVTYPTRKQTLTTCASVLFLVVLIAAFLGIVDIVLSKIIELILP